MKDADLQKLLDAEIVFENADGTYRLSEGAYAAISKMIESKPALFAQIFPDRLN